MYKFIDQCLAFSNYTNHEVLTRPTKRRPRSILLASNQCLWLETSQSFWGPVSLLLCFLVSWGICMYIFTYSIKYLIVTFGHWTHNSKVLWAVCRFCVLHTSRVHPRLICRLESSGWTAWVLLSSLREFYFCLTLCWLQWKIFVSFFCVHLLVFGAIEKQKSAEMLFMFYRKWVDFSREQFLLFQGGKCCLDQEYCCTTTADQPPTHPSTPPTHPHKPAFICRTK